MSLFIGVFSQNSYNNDTNLSIVSFVMSVWVQTLNLGVLKGQAGATTAPVKNPFSFNFLAI